MSKRLADTVGVLTNPQLPKDYTSAKTALKVHKNQKEALLDTLHIDHLVKEGTKLQHRMKTPVDSLKDNTDFIQSTSLVGRLLSQVISVGERLTQLWQTMDTKLQTNLELREYEFKCQQVISTILIVNLCNLACCRSLTGSNITRKNTLTPTMISEKLKMCPYHF